MDAAFSSNPYPSYTIQQLRAFVAAGNSNAKFIGAEIERREKVASGDLSVATPAERLRALSA